MLRGARASRLFAPVDVASLAAFRAGFGVLMLWHLLGYLVGGQLERHYVHPLVHFQFPGFEWVEPLPEAGLRVLFWALAAAAVGIAIGLFYRLSCALFFLGYGYVFLLDTAYYQNHLYLICLLALLLGFVPAHRGFSLDARRRPGLRSATVPAWSVWLLRFQVGVPYFFGGVAKLNADWLLRAQPMKIWLGEGTEGPLQAAFLRQEWAAYLLSWGGAALDLAVVPLLLWRRTRLAAYLVCVAFHLTNARLFLIGVFPWLMIWATLIFFPPDWPRRVRWLGRRRKAAGGRPEKAVPAAPGRRRLAAGLLAAWAAFQLAMPFRHFLRPGWVDWTEQSHRFSWRMKLRDKRGDVRFVAVDRTRGQVLPLVGVADVLTRQQRLMMRHDPEMMRQFAHHLAARMRDGDYGEVEVRAITSISFNGRPPQPLVDPESDLASVPRDAPADAWIVPLER